MSTIDATAGRDHEVLNPATGQPVRTVRLASVEETDAAIAAAEAAGPAWRAVSPADRGRLLRRFAEVVDGHVDELAELEVLNAGHTVGNARWEAGNVRDVLAYYSAAPERLFGRQIPVAGGLDVTFKEPLGVVGIIVPWNFPMPIAGWGFAPALAAGNTVVLKPAELTPLTAIRLGELALEAGLPGGGVHRPAGPGRRSWGSGSSPTPRCARSASPAPPRSGSASCAARPTRSSGSRSSSAARAPTSSSRTPTSSAPPRPRRTSVFDNAGQDCCARSRILVQRSVFDRFMELLEPAVRGVVVADPARDAAQMGPLISAGQRERVRSYVEESTEPVDVAFRGDCPEGDGFWYPATVVLPRGTDDAVWQEEIFGPVVAVMPFDDEDDAVAEGQRHGVRPLGVHLDP